MFSKKNKNYGCRFELCFSSAKCPDWPATLVWLWICMILVKHAGRSLSSDQSWQSAAWIHIQTKWNVTFLSLCLLWTGALRRVKLPLRDFPGFAMHTVTKPSMKMFIRLTLFGEVRTHPPQTKMVDFMVFIQCISQLQRVKVDTMLNSYTCVSYNEQRKRQTTKIFI